MLFSLLPTTALAATYPDSVGVYNANKKLIGLGDGECLTANEAERATSYTGDPSYVARYDKSSGTLYLKDYQGVGENGGITATSDLNIVVESDSTFTTSRTASTDTLMGIQANGTLTISGSGTLTVTANGNGTVYGIYADKGVTISAPLDVNVGKVDSSTNGSLYGIYTKSGAISLSGNDMTVTATGGKEYTYGVYNQAQTSSPAAGNGNITISGKLTVSLSNGSYNRGISSQGGVITLNGATVKILGNYRYGIFNLNGNVDIKSSPDVELTSTTQSGEGICTYDGGNLTIENSTVKVSVDTLAANLKGNVSIQDSKVELTSTYKHHEVIRTGNSSTANTIDLSGSGSVTLTASGEQTSAMITGKVTLGANTKCEEGTINGDSYDGKYDGSSKTVLKFVHESTAPTADISLSETGTVDFGSMEAGYTTAPTAETVTITNSGTADTGPLTIALDGANKTDFTLSKTSITDIAASGTDTFTVQPKTGLTVGIYNATVKVSGPGVTEQSFDVKFIVTAPLTPIAVPTANSVTYDGTEKTGVSDGTGYTLSGTYKATDVGATDYTATATLDSGFKWTDNTTDAKTINWNIGKRTPTAADFTFAPPTDLTYNGNNKTASVTLKSPLTKSGTITPTYMKGSSVVTETEDVGEYTVKIDVAGGGNFNAASGLTASAWTFSIAPANQNAPTGLGVKAPTASDGNGKITGTTTAMEYSTDSGFASPADCSATATEVAPGTYYVRYKADANHNAGAVSAALVVPAYSAMKYTVTVTSAGNGTASADMTSAVAGETVTLTATPNSGYVFDQWTDKTPDSLTIGADGKFTMPGENVSVKATFTKTSGGGSSSGGGGGGYVPTTQKPEIKAAAGGKAELSKDGTTLTITADAGKVIDKVLLNGKDMGAVSELKGLKTGDKVEVIFKDQVTEPTKEELDKAAKEAAGELVLPARSAKLKNGSVKVVVKSDLKAITDAGYTVKYKFYRSTKKSAGYKAMKTGKSGIYINTYGKKGTMYYYKARVMIYDKDGNFVAQTALKQCKYANRLWTK